MRNLPQTYNLVILNPQLAAEWHPTKNGSLTPSDVTPYSHKKVWWVCKKGHGWQAKIEGRSEGSGCPYCAGKAVNDENCLKTLNPALSREWHPTRNGSLTPSDVTLHSGKKVWWLCDKDHEWQSTIARRSIGVGCPYCSGRLATSQNCLNTMNPELAREWHPTGNRSITPNDVTPHSNKKVWWLCSRNHEWEATIDSRSYGSGCPYCANKAINDENCLKTVSPRLAQEWHPTRNGSLTPRNFTPYSSKKVWWLCKRGHFWEATIASRSAGNGCPYCHSNTSQLELLVYCELKYLFNNDVLFRKKVYGKECDIFIPSLKLGIEIDGEYWHREKIQSDKEKYLHLINKGINVINVRGKGLNRISDSDVFFSLKDKNPAIVHRIISKIAKQVEMDSNQKSVVERYLKEHVLQNESEYKKLFHLLPSPLVEYSLQNMQPSIAREWHPTRCFRFQLFSKYRFNSMSVIGYDVG